MSLIGGSCVICSILSFASSLFGAGTFGFLVGVALGVIAIIDYLKGGLMDREII